MTDYLQAGGRAGPLFGKQPYPAPQSSLVQQPTQTAHSQTQHTDSSFLITQSAAMSGKHLHRYVSEFEGRHNDRPLDTLSQTTCMVRGMMGKRLRYEDLIAEPFQAQYRLV